MVFEILKKNEKSFQESNRDLFFKSENVCENKANSNNKLCEVCENSENEAANT